MADIKAYVSCTREHAGRSTISLKGLLGVGNQRSLVQPQIILTGQLSLSVSVKVEASFGK